MPTLACFPRASERRSHDPRRLDGRRAVLGFTLLEMLVVLTIIAAMAAMVGPAGWRMLRSAELRGAEADLQAALTALPTFAFSEGRALAIDATALRSRLPTLPEGCRVLLPLPLRYAANGMADGGSAQLTCDGEVTQFEVIQITGEVRRVESRQ